MASRIAIPSIVSMLAVIACAGLPVCQQAFGDDLDQRQTSEPVSSGFAYDPEKEEGPHPESDFEWWYHFGFLRQQGSQYYSFVSSFQRNKNGRYLFYNLSDLTTGENYHYAVVDKSLFGATDGPIPSPTDGTNETRPNTSPQTGKRLLGWLLDVLPVLPEGHEFLTAPTSPPDPPKSDLWLCYGDNRLQKEGGSYHACYHNTRFSLDLRLERKGPPMPVGGTGLMGLDKPEDQHYYTYPRVSARGQLRKDGKETSLEGEFWYDHQWGKASAKTLMKWCWWGLRLDNGQNLSIFFLQDAKTNKTVQAGLTLHQPDGKTEFCKEVTFVPQRSWKSAHRRTYSVAWEIKAPALGLTVQTRTLTDDHEIPVLLYERIWEGPCRAEVSYQDGRKVKGSGFQEMIGQGQ